MGRPPIGKAAMSGAQRQSRYIAKLRRPLAKPRALSPSTNQPKHDLVFTPQSLADQIVAHFGPMGICMDPCRGPSRPFFNALVGAPGVSRVDWCEVTEGRCFYEYHGHVDWIITNPPWSCLRQFMAHCLEVADNVVLLAPLSSLLTRARRKDIEAAGFGLRECLYLDNPPKPWPGGGFQLCAMWLQRGWRGKLTITDDANC